jgi:hypothetical protein
MIAETASQRRERISRMTENGGKMTGSRGTGVDTD